MATNLPSSKDTSDDSRPAGLLIVHRVIHWPLDTDRMRLDTISNGRDVRRQPARTQGESAGLLCPWPLVDGNCVAKSLCDVMRQRLGIHCASIEMAVRTDARDPGLINRVQPVREGDRWDRKGSKFQRCFARAFGEGQVAGHHPTVDLPVRILDHDIWLVAGEATQSLGVLSRHPNEEDLAVNGESTKCREN